MARMQRTARGKVTSGDLRRLCTETWHALLAEVVIQ